VVAAGTIPALAPGDTFSESVIFGSETMAGLQVYLPRVRGEDPSGNALQPGEVIDAFGVQTEGAAFRTTALSGPAAVFCENPTDATTCSLERQNRAAEPTTTSGSDAQAVRYAFYNDGTVDFVSHSLFDDVAGVVFTDRVETVVPLDSLVVFRIDQEVAGIGETRTATWTAVTSDGETFTQATDEAPLPVELVQFEAQISGNNVILEWKTASETNNAGFEIQRRTAGEWDALIFVEGAGTTDTPQEYRFRDTALPFADSLMYRLRQVDTDGTEAFSDPVVIHQSVGADVQLATPFPNPVRHQATVRYVVPSGEAKAVQLQVYNVLGQRVATLVDETKAPGRQEIALNTSGWASGTYFLRLQVGGVTQTQRMSVVR
jgi:hypothetical protein